MELRYEGPEVVTLAADNVANQPCDQSTANLVGTYNWVSIKVINKATGNTVTYTPDGKVKDHDGNVVGNHSFNPSQVVVTAPPTPTPTPAPTSTNTIWSWGRNSYGAIGNGSEPIKAKAPSQESTGATNWAQISGGNDHTVAIKTDGTYWGWGHNSNGQLGNGTNNGIPSPSQIGPDNTWFAISAAKDRTVALKEDRTLWSWGWNPYGQIGDGSTSDKDIPTQESTGATDWAKISAGDYFTLAIKENGTLWAFGYNEYGELGDGTTNTSPNSGKHTPTQEATGSTKWSKISAGHDHSLALKENGSLWSWGRNSFGQIGDQTVETRTVPTKIGSETWVAIAAGHHFSLAIKNDGTLWAWGRNVQGQIGQGGSEPSSIPSPTRIGTDNNWSNVSAGEDHAIAIKQNGTLWAWGGNAHGQLGTGELSGKTEPTRVGNLNTWKMIAAGNNHTVAFK